MGAKARIFLGNATYLITPNAAESNEIRRKLGNLNEMVYCDGIIFYRLHPDITTDYFIRTRRNIAAAGCTQKQKIYELYSGLFGNCPIHVDINAGTDALIKQARGWWSYLGATGFFNFLNNGNSNSIENVLMDNTHRYQRSKTPSMPPEQFESYITLDIENAKRSIERLLHGIFYEEDGGSRRISSEVQTAVWTRDKGRCVSCGSNKNLHFDHRIPFSMGGSSSIENIQLLCAECNLKKSDKIGGKRFQRNGIVGNIARRLGDDGSLFLANKGVRFEMINSHLNATAEERDFIYRSDIGRYNLGTVIVNVPIRLTADGIAVQKPTSGTGGIYLGSCLSTADSTVDYNNFPRSVGRRIKGFMDIKNRSDGEKIARMIYGAIGEAIHAYTAAINAKSGIENFRELRNDELRERLRRGERVRNITSAEHGQLERRLGL